jgi:DMSO/TMAO reductase YedYZ molybdopterin-dependent catalytic subunit
MNTSDSEIEKTPSDAAVAQEAKLRSRRAFIGLGLAGLAGALGWNWLIHSDPVGGLPGGLRKVLDANGELATAYFKHARLAPEFPKSRAEKLRTNGKVGLPPEFDPATWRLKVAGYRTPDSAPPREFSLDDLKALPRTEMTVEFKCIEGWSQIVTWAGVRLSDFLAHYPLATASGQPLADPAKPSADLAPYVSLVTPDEKYYVGLDIESALHPQTLLCYEMNGAPLSLQHGAPLRLAIALKYGVKQIKRIGTIAFLAERPADYWAARGYDWHAGH